MDIETQVRGYSYLAGVLENRELDPFCRSCNSFQSTLFTVRDNVSRFADMHAAEIEKLPHGMSFIFLVARSKINGIKQRVDTRPQKKSGNCKMPEGVCLLKSSLSITQKIQ